VIIPISIGKEIQHFSWLNNEKSKKKCEYQKRHFSGVCGYKWNEKENKLEFNELYYRSIGQFIPFTGQD
jgi:hypothetical protein